MKKKGAFILGGILSFFLVIIFTLKYCSHPRFITLPDFGKLELKDDFFIDDNGDSLYVDELKGKILLVNYLSIDCPQNCPLKFNLFKFFIYDQLVENEGFKDVKIISVFLDSSDNLVKKMHSFNFFIGSNVSLCTIKRL